MPDKIDQLYDALKADKAVSKSRENFRSFMLAPGTEGYQNRLKLFKALKADGAVQSKTYEEFRSKLVKPSVRKQQASAIIGGASGSSVPEGWGELDTSTAGIAPVMRDKQPQPSEGEQKAKQMVAQTNRALRGDKAAAAKTGLTSANQRMKDEMDYSMATGKELRLGMNLPGVAPTVARDEHGDILNGENGEPLVGTTTDEQRVAQYQQQERERSRKEMVNELVDRLQKDMEKKAFGEYKKSRDGGKGNILSHGLNSDSFSSLAAYNQASSPEQLLRLLNENYGYESPEEKERKSEELRKQGKSAVLANWDENEKKGSFINRFVKENKDRIEDAALRSNMSVEDYVWNELVPNLSNDIAERFGQNMSEKYSVKGTADYLMREMSNSLIGTLASMSVNTKSQRQYMQEELQKSREGKGAHYNASFGSRLAGETLMFAADASPMMVGGAIGGYTAKGVGSALKALGATELGTLVSTGSSFLAANVGAATKYLGYGIKGALGMAPFMGASSAVQDMSVGDGTLSSIGRAFLEGSWEGAKFGLATSTFGLASGSLGKNISSVKGKLSYGAGAFLVENQIFAGLDYIKDPENFNWRESSMDAMYMQLASKLSSPAHLKETAARFVSMFKPGVSRQPIQLNDTDKEYIQKAFGGMDFTNIAGDVNNIGKILSDKENIPWVTRQKVEGYTTNTFESSRPRTNNIEESGNRLLERAADGELIEVHDFKDEQERDAIRQDIYDRRANDDMMADYAVLLQKRNAVPTQEQIDNARKEIFSDMQKRDSKYDASNLEEGGADYQAVVDRANEKNNQATILIETLANDYGKTTQEVYEAMRKNSVERDFEEQSMIEDLQNRLHDAAFPKGEYHPSQSAIDGADEAGHGPVVDPEVSAALSREVDASVSAYNQFMQKHTDVLEGISSLGDARPDEVMMYIDQNFSGEEHDEGMRVVSDYFNALAKKNAYIEEVGKNIESHVSTEIDRNGFKGNIDGAPDTENIITLTDGKTNPKTGQPRRLTLLNGDVGTIEDASSGRRVLDSEKSGGQIICRDEDGQFVILKPDAKISFVEKMPKEDYAKNLREELGVQNTQTIIETGLEKPEVAGGSSDKEADGKEPITDSEAAQPAVEAGQEKTGGDEAAGETPIEQPTPTPSVEGNRAVEVPTDKDGVKRYEQSGIDVDAAIEDLQKDQIDPTQMADAMISEAEETIKKIGKKKNPKPADIVKDTKARLDAQQVIDYWSKLRNRVVQQRADELARESAEREERRRKAAEEAALQARQKQEEELSADERFKANRERFSASREEGDEDSIVLANGETIDGHYVLVEADAVTPSHNPRGNFAKSEGFPVDENGKTINDRDYENDKNAQVLVQKRSQAYDQRAVNTPVVVSEDGIVLSGNDRTMSGQLAAEQGTDKAYVDYITKHAKKWGFTEEQISNKKNPRIVFVPKDKMEYNAETFAKFNQDEKKSQSKLETSVKMGKVLATKPQTLGRIGSIIDQVENLSDLYSDVGKTKDVLLAMKEGGLITDEGIARLTDENGLLSAQGKDEFETMLAGVVVDEDALRILNNPANSLGDLRKSIAYAVVPLVKNQTLGEYSIVKDVSEAVRLYDRARKAGLVGKNGDITNYFINKDAFDGAPMDTHSLAQLLLANQMSKGGYHLKRIIEAYNAEGQNAAAGQVDMWSGGVRSKEDIISDILKQQGYDAESIRQRVERLRETQPPVERDSEGREGGTDRADDSKGEGDAEPERKPEPEQRVEGKAEGEAEAKPQPAEKEPSGKAEGTDEQGKNEKLFDFDEIEELKGARSYVKETIKDKAVLAYDNAHLKTPWVQFGVPEEKQEKMSYEKFLAEFRELAGESFTKSCEPYLPKVYEYIKERLDNAIKKKQEQRAKDIEYLKPRNEKEKKIVNDVLEQLQQDIDAAMKERDKAASAYEKARAKESDKATDMFSDDNAFKEKGQLFDFEDMPTDRSQEGVNKRTSAERERLLDAQEKLNKLQSEAERNSRIRGALDNERRQTEIETEGEPLDNPTEALEKAATEFKKEQDKEIGITHDETPEQKADRENAEKLADTPITSEEIDGASLSDVEKTLAKAYLNGNQGFLQKAAYLKAYDNVRNRRQDGTGDSLDAGSGTQLDSRENQPEPGSGRTGGSDLRMAETESARVGVGSDELSQSGMEDGERRVLTSSGEGGDNGVSGRTSGLDGLSSGSERRGGRSVHGESRPELGVGQSGGRSGSNTGTTQAGSDAAIAASKQRLAELRKRFKQAGRNGTTSVSLIGMNAEQIEVLMDITTEAANLGYQYLAKGVREFKAWNQQMLDDFHDWLHEDMKWSDREIDEYLNEVWNCEYNIDGVTRTIGEWASFLGEKELRKVVREDLGTKFEKQKAAESVEVKAGDIDNIRETLPYLLPEQQDDVLKAETQFFDEKHSDREHGYGKGMMFTNGTGTGKTYTGLGIVKRFVKQGKGRVLILTPSQEKVTDWANDGLNLGLTLEKLDDVAKEKGTTATKSKGTGVVVTTYANARQNLALLEDCFDLIVYDESHKITEGKEAAEGEMYKFHQMLTNKDVEKSMDRQTYWLPEWIEYRNLVKERDENRKRLNNLDNFDNSDTVKIGDEEVNVGELRSRLNARMLDIENRFEELRPIMQEIRESKRGQAEIDSKRTKTVFLSATPFNTRENMKYAEGYLFSYPEEDPNTKGSYNHRSPEDAFLERYFPAGYRWRYGRLESHVENAEALGRQEIDFSDYLQNQLGTLSGRMISSEYDYSRDFPILTLDHAGRFNQAMSEVYRNKRYNAMSEAFHKAFDYNYSTALFEAMKTSLVIDRIKEHLKRGQKVVVFHRRRTSGDLEPPFARALDMARVMAEAAGERDDQKGKQEILNAVKAFSEDFADMLEWEKGLDYTLPRDQIAKVFGEDKIGFYSGAESKKAKHQTIEDFMKDNGGKDIIVIQEASGKEGISLHDKTGEHQRVEINLALPQSPIAFIQIEGRIYRIGQKSNAIFEYPLLGLDLETSLFAQKFNSALGTTENLALGSKARNLRKSIANSILLNTGEVDYDRQGLGGKDMDGQVASRTKDSFDEAISDYYGNQKMKGGRDNREGYDYFPTPEPVGFKMVEWAQLMEGESALEPSAGHGAIARYVPETNPLTAIEPSADLFSKLQMRAGGPGRRFEDRTFENYPLANKHDVIVMNPPYGVQGKMAMEHVAKAFKHLNEGGRLIAIIPDGPAMERRFDAWLDSTGADGTNGANVLVGEVKLPDVAFGRAGTNVRTRIVVIDKVTRAQMRDGMPDRVEMDLSGAKTVDELFEQLRHVNMPERTIDQAAIAQKQALKTKKSFEDNKFVREVVVDEKGVNISNRSSYGSVPSVRINFDQIDNPRQRENLLVQVDGLMKARDNAENIDYGKWKNKTYGSGKNAVPAVEAIRDYCDTAIKTIANVLKTTPDGLEKEVKAMKEEAERQRQERMTELQNLRDEQERRHQEKVNFIVETALKENPDNETLTTDGIRRNMEIAHGRDYLEAAKAKRTLRDAGIDWQTGHKIPNKQKNIEKAYREEMPLGLDTMKHLMAIAEDSIDANRKMAAKRALEMSGIHSDTGDAKEGFDYSSHDEYYEKELRGFLEKASPIKHLKTKIQEREEGKPSSTVAPKPAGRKESYEYKLDQNTKTGADMHLVVMNERVDDATYKDLQRKAKALNDGYYNRFKKAWHFKTEEDARKFMEQAGAQNGTRFSEEPAKKTPKTVFSEELEKQVKRDMREGKLAYIKDVTLPSESGTSEQGDQHTLPAGAVSSESKDRNNSDAIQENGQEIGKINNSGTKFKEGTDVSGLPEHAQKIVHSIEKTAKKLNTPVKIARSIDEVTNKDALQALREGRIIKGWFEEGTGEIVLYLPNIADKYSAMKTVAHEVVGHHGLRELLGEKGYRDYMRTLWLDMKDESLSKYIKENYARHGDIYTTIDEYLAEAAEKGYGKLPMWQKVRDVMTDAMRKAGFEMTPSISDVKYMVWLSKNQLRQGEPMSEMKRQSLLYRLGKEKYEAKVKNGEFVFGDSSSESSQAVPNVPFFPGNRTYFRSTPSAKTAKMQYERSLNRLGYAWKESHIDQMQAGVELMRAISGVKKIEDIPSVENFVLAENQMSSKEEQMDYLFHRDYMNPLSDAVASVLPEFGSKTDDALRELQIYMIKKSGLERNRCLYVRDKIREYRKDDSMDQNAVQQLEDDWNQLLDDIRDDIRNGQIDLREYLENMDAFIKQNIDPNFKAGDHDYSGLTAMTGSKKGYDDVAVIDDVMNTESMVGDERIKNLWEKTKAVSQYGLDMEYEGGLDSKEKHDKVSRMFEWYVPMRGYDETRADDVYDYLEENKSTDYAGPVLMNAKGRESLSNVDLFAQLGAMSSNAVHRALKNEVKQVFARFIRNHYGKDGDDRLVTELKYLWGEKRYDPVTGKEYYEEVFPDIPENATADEIAKIVEDFESDMKAKEGTGDAKRMRQNSSIPFRPSQKNKPQHIVEAYINGEKKTFIVNGNPRAAQAINGQLKSETNHRVITRITRMMAQLNTSYNPDFIVGNTERDYIFSSAAILAKENMKYFANWQKNYFGRGIGRGAVGVPSMHTNLFKRYRSGSLNMSNETDRYFKEFMENGGETGWVEQKNLDKWRKEIRDGVRVQGTAEKAGRFVIKAIPEAIEAMNERDENAARFATYMTSRQMGRSIMRSVSDAKEVSVNFNRKGAGLKTKGIYKNDGSLKRINAVVAARTAQYGQDYLMFYNAGVQGLNNASKILRDHPIKASTIFAGFALGAFLMSNLNQALIDDEDPNERGGIHNPYAELPEWIRRNRLCLYIGKGEFITIDLPIELRALYGIGDIAAAYTTHPELKSEKPVWRDVLTQMTQILPVDFMGEHPGEPWMSFVPSFAMPIAEVFMNQNWYGRKIEKDQYINENDPRWKRAYKNANQAYIDVSKTLNAFTNSYSKEELKKMGIKDSDINDADSKFKGSADGKVTDPAIVEHIVNGYFGGAGQTAGRLAHIFKAVKDGKDFGEIVMSNQMPIVRRTHYSPTEQNKMARTRSKWWHYKEEMDNVMNDVKVFKEHGVSDPLAKMKQISTEDSVRATRASLMKSAQKQYTKMKKIYDKTENEEMRKDIEMRMDQLMENTVNGLDAIK